MNNIKRWYYELAEKQISRITTIMAIIGILFSVISFFIPYLLGRLPKGSDFIIYICGLCLLPSFLYTIGHLVFWFSPYKQEYLLQKEHNEIIVKVREKFGLGPEFKEILYVPSETDYDFINFLKVLNELEIKYFAEELDGVILVSVRSKGGKELESLKIEDYNFFDLNFKPK